MAGAAQQGGQGDNSSGILWGIAAIFATVLGIWFLFKKYIVYTYLTIKLYETHLINLVSNDRLSALRDQTIILLSNPDNVAFNQILAIGEGVGNWLRVPIAIILFLLAGIVYVSNSTRVFKRTYSMREFANLEKTNWPQIAPVMELDLLKTDIDKGPWAMALTPMQFCKRYKLLEEVQVSATESRRNRGRVDVVLKRGDANKLFALQLGALWESADKLPPYARALFAAFAARINSDTKEAARLLSQLSATSTSKLDFTGVDALLNKHLNTPLVQKIIQTHAYVFTVMAAMLAAARDDGVQASADFLWLKPLDRKLWYTLNMVGRQTPFAEVAGIFAHWVAEKEAGRRLQVPMVEEAMRALEIALKEVVYRPD